jgi:hypothetical protein
LDHFTGLWDEPTARPLEVGAAAEVGAVVRVGVAVGPDVVAGAVEAAGGPVGLGVFCATGLEFFCATVGLTLSPECPVPDEESGAVARGVAGCVAADCGTNGELMLGPPSIVLISRAT